MVEKILELGSPIIASLAWPFTVIAIVLLLRRHLQKLIDRLEKVETKWGNFTFPRGLDDIKANFDKVEGLATADELLEKTEKPETKELYVPVAEVMSGWADVERLCQQLLEKKGGVHIPKPNLASWLRLLKRNQLIDSEHAAILDKLRQLRNIAVHGGPGTVGACEAQEYIALADRMMRYLGRQIADE